MHITTLLPSVIRPPAPRSGGAPLWHGALAYLRRLLMAGLPAILVAAAAHAANPSDWWVDIANDRAEQVKSMLARGADPNELSPRGQPAIMQAIRDGAWKVYDVLAAHPKTIVNAMNTSKETPLMYLAVAGQTERAQKLIRRGALVNKLDWTPLQYAASKGHVDTVKMLLANKALVNAPGPDGITALMMAAYGGSEPVAQLLLNAGADPTMQDALKRDAADWARLKNHNALAGKLDKLTEKILADRAALRERNRAGHTAGDTPTAGQDGVRTVDLNAVDAGGSGGQAAKAEDKAAPASSTSRYFDLERFEKGGPATP